MKSYILALGLLGATACAHPAPVVAPTPPSQAAIIERTLHSVGHLIGKIEMTTEYTVDVASTMSFDPAQLTYGCTAFAIDARKWMTAAHCIGREMMIDDHPAFLVIQDKALDLAVVVSDYVRPALTIREEPLHPQEEVVGLGYGYSWKYPVITHHYAVLMNFSPLPDIAPGTWFNGGFIGGQSGGVLIDRAGLVVGVIQRSDYQYGYGVNSATMLEFLRPLK